MNTRIREALKNRYSILVIIDLLVMVLLIINLSLILFDWIYSISLINDLFEKFTPEFHGFYDVHIHRRFHEIDLIFVAVYLAEFTLSWILAIINKVYYKWFFYPFAHWYDLLGSVPVSSFRFLRVLRVFSILMRLQNLGIIDLTNTYLYEKLRKYYGIVVEEISDRVVIKILDGVQDEIREGGPVLENIVKDVIRPKQEQLVRWVAGRMQVIMEKEVMVKQDDIESYVDGLIREGLKNNSEMRTIEHLPIMGRLITETIEKAISGIINNVLTQMLSDLASEKNRVLVDEVSNVILSSIEYKDKAAETEEDKIFRDIAIDVLDVIKDQVNIKQWRLKEEEEKNADVTEKGAVQLLMIDDGK